MSDLRQSYQNQSSNSDFLQVEDLSWQVDGHAILKNIRFSVQKGSFIGLIGPNGAGKSSLLRCLYRVIRPSQGRVALQQQNIWKVSAREHARRVAVVLQETGSAQFGIRVWDVVQMGLTPHKSLFAVDTGIDRQAIHSAIAQVGLSHLAQARFDHLSGGEKQRALIARAIVQKPDLLLMDEPTNHLDVRYQIQVLELARSLGITVIASIHDLNLASAFADSLLLLNHGELLQHGAPDQVLTEKMLSEVFGVCCHIDPHPDTGSPRISYFYGYQGKDQRENQQNTAQASAGGRHG